MSTLEDAFFHRRWWAADVQHDAGGMLLHPRPGAQHTVLWRSTLAVFDNRTEPTERLEAAVGDCLLVVGADPADIAFVTVMEVAGEQLRVGIGAGGISPAITSVRLLEANGLRQTRHGRKPRNARRGAPGAAP